MSIGTLQCSWPGSAPASKKRFCESAIVRLPLASQLAVTETSGKPGCSVQPAATFATSLPLAELKPAQRSALVAFENARALM